MPACLVNRCLNRTGRKGQSREIVLHKFPNDPMRIRCWLLQTGQAFQNLESLVEMIHEGQKRNKYFLCSSHFAADAYVHARVLRQDAVPSIFPPIKVGESIIQESLKKLRVRSKKRPLEWTSTENMGVHPSCTSAGIYPEDADIRQFTWTGNMDVQSSGASADTFPGDTDIKHFQWTTNVDVQSSSTLEDTDIKPLKWTLTANMDGNLSGTSMNIFPEDSDIKPSQLALTANMDVQSSSTSVDIFSEDTDIKPSRLIGNVNVQSSCTSANIFTEDIDIKPDISKPSCCTIETQTEFTLCNSTVTFLDQDDKPPADPVITETPVQGLQGPVLSTPTAPTGKIALFTGHPGLCFFVNIKTTC